MKVIDKVKLKAYECKSCGSEKQFNTNHWGDVYPFCSVCDQQTVWQCNDPMPEDFKKPEEWSLTRIEINIK